MLKKEQRYYMDKWEDLEVQTSRSRFNEVFTHTSMIFANAKAKQNLLEEFREVVKNEKQVNQYLFWLNKVGNSDWMPSAIRFMAEHRNDPDYVFWF